MTTTGIATKKTNCRTLLLWLTTGLCMAFIFYMSAQPAEASAQMSNQMLLWMNTLLGAGITDFVVRKLAHMMEFALLCFLLNSAFYYTKQQKPAYFWSVLLTSCYGAADEFHQLFVPGRACQLRDWAIDTGGAVLGALFFWLLLCLCRQIKKRNTAKGVTI